MSEQGRGRTVTIKDIAGDLGLSRGFINKQIHSGKLKAHRFGRKLVVMVEDYEEWISNAEYMPGNSWRKDGR